MIRKQAGRTSKFEHLRQVSMVERKVSQLLRNVSFLYVMKTGGILECQVNVIDYNLFLCLRNFSAMINCAVDVFFIDLSLFQLYKYISDILKWANDIKPNGFECHWWHCYLIPSDIGMKIPPVLTSKLSNFHDARTHHLKFTFTSVWRPFKHWRSCVQTRDNFWVFGVWALGNRGPSRIDSPPPHTNSGVIFCCIFEKGQKGIRRAPGNWMFGLYSTHRFRVPPDFWFF